MNDTVYQPQYRRIDHYNRATWHNAGLEVSRPIALQMVQESPHKYFGVGATHRMVAVTRTVAEFRIDWKENN